MTIKETLLPGLKDYEKHNLMLSLADEVDHLLSGKNPEKEKEVKSILKRINDMYLPLHISICKGKEKNYEFQIWRLAGSGKFFYD